jgi:hypothetical protein
MADYEKTLVTGFLSISEPIKEVFSKEDKRLPRTEMSIRTGLSTRGEISCDVAAVDGLLLSAVRF